ncbi:hypothetical protein E1287_15830 [Actinomadura sp. KC06]|uniref:hypothetical protein n=1 Tax=Actinomadura sp. KC06 TaxID=2530369 RepID=UPI00104E6BB1|nr:hypothetical protein [Actinomadura sp. KC06]TDD34663.1 hypothetical protein E1287_15830 [Actinomadura sp. KC06]
MSATARNGTGERNIFARGTNNAVYTRHGKPYLVWDPWENVGGQTTSAIGVDPQFDGDRLDLAVRGADGKVWHKAHGLGGAWHKLGDLDIQGTPVVRHFAGGDAIIFARGADNAAWTIYQDKGVWGLWVRLGGDLRSDLDVAWTAGVAGVFGRGANDQLMYYPLSAQEPAWTPLGHVLASAPSLATPSNERIDVAVRGTDNAVWHRALSAGAWGPWMSREGNTSDQPVVDFGYTLGILDVDFLVRSPNNRLWTRAWYPDRGTSTTWLDLEGAISTRPTPLAYPAGFNIFARGTNGAAWYWYL